MSFNQTETIGVPKPLASIVIVVSGPVDRLLACLKSLQTHGPSNLFYEVIVVLNAPPSAEIDKLRGVASDVTVIVSAANLGLAGGANRARGIAQGKYIVLLHDDTEVEPGWLEALVATAEANPQAGAVGSRQIWPDGSFQAAGLVLWSDASGTSPWLTNSLPTAARRVDTCGTASLLVRAAAWDAIGGLDERFYPAYYVDSDLCMALYEAGYVVLVEPSSCLKHWKGESSRPPFQNFLMSRHWGLFTEKWRDALARQEDRNPRDLASSIERALARLDRLPCLPPQTKPQADARPLRNEDHEQRHVDRERHVLAAYSGHLEHQLRKAPIPIYTIGSDLSFAEGGDAFRYVVENDTYPAENWGAWIKQSCRIFLPLAADTRIGRCERLEWTLMIAARHFCSEDKQTSAIKVFVNGIEVLYDRVSRDGEHDHTVTISDIACSVSPYIAIMIDNEEAKSPASIGIGSDERPIGVGLRKLRLDIGSVGERED